MLNIFSRLLEQVDLLGIDPVSGFGQENKKQRKAFNAESNVLMLLQCWELI